MSNIVKYKMKLEVLTPLHIGGADYKSNITKKEYLFEEENEEKKVLRIVDGQKFIDYLIKNRLFDKYISLINESINEKVEEHKRNLSLKKILTNLGISINDFKNNFQKKSYVIIDKKFQIKNDIKLMERNLFSKPYIPGSSIKGALISFLLIDYIINHRNEFKKEKQILLDEAKKVSNKNEANSFRDNIAKNIIGIIEDYILYSKEMEYSVRERVNNKNKKKENYIYVNNKKNIVKKHGISISDSYSYVDTKTTFYQDYDEKIGKETEPMPLSREYIMEKSKFNFDIILDMDLLKNSRLEIKNIDDLLKKLGNSSRYLIEDILEDSNNPKTENLILGANTGFYQKTIISALFENKKELIEIVKKILHKNDGNNKGQKINNHLNDKTSPRVINRINIGGKNLLAGLVKIEKVDEKNVGTN